MVNKLELSDFELHVAIGLRHRCFEFKREGNRMPPVKSFDDYWADSEETVSRLDRIACFFVGNIGTPG